MLGPSVALGTLDRHLGYEDQEEPIASEDEMIAAGRRHTLLIRLLKARFYRRAQRVNSFLQTPFWIARRNQLQQQLGGSRNQEPFYPSGSALERWRTGRLPVTTPPFEDFDPDHTMTRNGEDDTSSHHSEESVALPDLWEPGPEEGEEEHLEEGASPR